MKALTEWGKAALDRLIGGKADKHKNPFQNEHGRTYMRFDRLEFANGEPDEFGRPTKDILFFFGGVHLYTMNIANVGPNDTVTLSGIDAKVGVDFSAV